MDDTPSRPGRGRPRKNPFREPLTGAPAPDRAPLSLAPPDFSPPEPAPVAPPQDAPPQGALFDAAPFESEASPPAAAIGLPAPVEAAPTEASTLPIKAPKARKLSLRERRTVKPLPSQVVDGAGPIFKAVDDLVSLVDENDPELFQKAEKLFKQYVERHGKDGEWMFERDLGRFLQPQPHPLPGEVGQPTMQEARGVAIAISDGRTLSHWDSIASEVGAALRHVLPGGPFQIRLSPSAACIAWHKGMVSETDLRELLQGFDLDAVFLFHSVLGSCIQKLRENELYLTVSLDELITAIGWGKAARRNSQERNRLRAIIWSWLLTFDGMEVVGTRAGTYRDPDSRQMLDLTSEDSLIRIMSRRMSPDAATPDGRQIPLTVTFAPGPWVQRWKNNRQILSEFGNIRILAQIPSGKAAGAWARCIGMVLLQLWREGASRSVHEDQGQTIVQWKPFTRRQLLTGMLNAEPDVKEILNSKDPLHAQEYWRQAIAMLQEIGFIAQYKELNSIAGPRKGWGERWLDQKIDIMPGEGDKKVAEEIGKVANSHRARNVGKKKRGRPRKSADEEEKPVS